MLPIVSVCKCFYLIIVAPSMSWLFSGYVTFVSDLYVHCNEFVGMQIQV